MSEEKAWYIVHTQTGHEDKVREKILLNIEIQGFGDRVFQVLVPTEEVVEVKQNKKILRKRKFFPGYVLVQMNMTSEAYWFIKSITGVTGFLGDPYSSSPWCARIQCFNSFASPAGKPGIVRIRSLTISVPIIICPKSCPSSV